MERKRQSLTYLHNTLSLSVLSCFCHVVLPHCEEVEAVPVHILTLMTEKKQVAETLDFDADTMRLIAQEHFVDHSLLYMFITVSAQSNKQSSFQK